MNNPSLDTIKNRIYSLSASTPIETDLFDTQIYDADDIAHKLALLEVYRYLFALDSLGIPLSFLMNLSDIHARLLIMVADGKFLPEIIEKLNLNINDLFSMGHKILIELEQTRPPLKEEEKGNVEIFIKDFIINEIELNNI